MKKQSSAVDLLREIMKEKSWWKGSDLTKQDRDYYRKAKNLTESTAAKVLEKLGWIQVSPPVWEKKKAVLQE